jgi:hypothetical protein
LETLWRHGSFLCAHSIVHFFTGQAYVLDRIYRRLQKLLTRMRHSDNERVSFLAEVMVNDSSSTVCRNLLCITQRHMVLNTIRDRLFLFLRLRLMN